MKKQFKNMAFYLALVMFSFVLMSAGGGKSDGKSRGSGNNGDGSTCPTKTIPLVLFQGNINVNTIPNRNSGWGNFMPVGNIINEQQATSPPSLYQDINLSYCHITITATGCSSYGNGGTKSFVWDSSNDGNNYDNTMNIEIPENASFTITIDLHEGCGPWYNGSNPHKRAMWIHQGNYNPAPSISISTWSLNRVDNC
jgi:hypothetical protein